MKHARRVEPILEDLRNLDLDLTEIAYRNGVSESIVRAIARDEDINMRTRTHILKARRTIRDLEGEIERSLPDLHKTNHRFN